MDNQQASSNVIDIKDFDELILADKKDGVLKDTELEFLGQLLLKDGLVIPTVKSVVQSSDFLYTEHKILYQTILNLYGRKITPNMLTIAEELRRTGELDKVGYGLVLSLGEVAFTTAYAETHAQTIKQRSNRRKLFHELQEYTAQSRKLAAMLLDPKISTDSVLDTAKQIFKNVDVVQVKRGIKLGDFFKESFKKLCKINHEYSKRCTGFDSLDAAQIFSPGVYTLGGTPATGKTTFAWQLLNQLAILGEQCIYCTFEMSALELASKTLSRTLYQRDKSATLTAADIRNEGTSATLEQIFNGFCADNQINNLEVLELTDESIDDLLRLLDPYCYGVKSPVVCLDYLQIVPPSAEKDFPSDKAKIDDMMRKLKNFQRETQTTFIVISSLNRASYTTKAEIDMASFKESGAIEYSSDVIWALQLEEIEGIDAKSMQPRPIILKCLKNRQGQNYSIKFDYYSAYDFFTEHKEIFDDDEEESRLVYR